MKKQIKKSAEPLKPTVVGTGLVALDVVVSGDDVKYFAGGTCGNVLTCLSYLGWDAKPVARLKTIHLR